MNQTKTKKLTLWAIALLLLAALIPQVALASDTPLAVGTLDDGVATESAVEAAPVVSYRVKILGKKWQEWKSANERAGIAASRKRICNLKMRLNPGSYSGDITYRVRFSNGRWSSWATSGTAVGSSQRIEAIQVKLTGPIAKDYDVVYRTFVSGVGWQSRVRNGMTAGTSEGRRIGALRVNLTKRAARTGWVGKGKTWRYYEKGSYVTSRWVTTTESPIQVLTTRKRRYWIDATGKLALRRVIDPTKEPDKDAGFAAYATRWGFPLKGGKVATSQGVLLADRSGKLLTATGWLKTAAYDDEKQCYYMKSLGSYSIARTGFFKVKGKRYYGLPKQGYVLRDAIRKIEGKWYSASASGVVRRSSSAAALVERYVRWAVKIANDSSHGYTQDLAGRWGPDYDCSSLVISAVKSVGINTGSASWTGNMKSELTKHGFKWHTNMSKIKRGDILLVHSNSRQHTEIYLGKGKTVGAHIAETGGVYGVTGDQTGHEIDVGPYYSIWQGYLRYSR